MSTKNFTLMPNGPSDDQRELMEHIGKFHGALLPRRFGTTTAIAEYCGTHPEKVALVLTQSQRLSAEYRKDIDKFGPNSIFCDQSVPYRFTCTRDQLIIVDCYTNNTRGGEFFNMNYVHIMHNAFIVFDPLFDVFEFERLPLQGQGLLVTKVWNATRDQVPPDAKYSDADMCWSWLRPCNMGENLQPLVDEQKDFVHARCKSSENVGFEFKCQTTSVHMLEFTQIQDIVTIMDTRDA